MSAQSLLSEVPSNLATQHVIKSADQLHFKDKQVYTQQQTELIHSAASKATGSDNEEKSTSGSESQPLSAVSTLQNKLKEGIEAVYKTVDHALHGDTSTSSNASSTDVEALRKDVASLKTENQQLHKEIAEIRQILQKHYQPLCGVFASLGHNVLIMGDGNLSFSLALARLLPEKRIVASVLESRVKFLSTYPSGQHNLKQLEFCTNVEVRFSVDATNIQQTGHVEPGYFSDIIMNFPHHGGKSNFKKSRELLHKIFCCLSHTLMTTNGTRFHLTLAKGQSGVSPKYANSHAFFVNKMPDHEKDSWQVLYTAAKSALRAEHAEIFLPQQFVGYQPAGYKNRDQMFHNEQMSLTFSFVKSYDFDPHKRLTLEQALLIEAKANLFPKRNMKSCIYHSFRPLFEHDISVLFADLLNGVIEETQNQLFILIQTLVGPFIAGMDEVVELRTNCPKSNLHNRIYRLCWQGWSVPLSKELCNIFQENLRLLLHQSFQSSNCGLSLS